MHETWMKWAENVHLTAFEELARVKSEVSDLSLEDLADAGYVLKKMYERIDDLRKELKKAQALIEKVACLKSLQEQKDKLYGSLAVATTEVEIYAKLPHPEKTPEQWQELMEFLGIPEQVVKADLIHRLHWPAFTEFLTERVSNGKSLPAGIKQDETGARHYLKYRKR